MQNGWNPRCQWQTAQSCSVCHGISCFPGTWPNRPMLSQNCVCCSLPWHSHINCHQLSAIMHKTHSIGNFGRMRSIPCWTIGRSWTNRILGCCKLRKSKRTGQFRPVRGKEVPKMIGKLISKTFRNFRWCQPCGRRSIGRNTSTGICACFEVDAVHSLLIVGHKLGHKGHTVAGEKNIGCCTRIASFSSDFYFCFYIKSPRFHSLGMHFGVVLPCPPNTWKHWFSRQKAHRKCNVQHNPNNC